MTKDPADLSPKEAAFSHVGDSATVVEDHEEFVETHSVTADDGDEIDFYEGGLYAPEELPESDMTHSGNLEMVGDGRYAALYGDTYVTFEIGMFECVDVRHKDDLGGSDD